MRNFKFFVGIIKPTLTATWSPEFNSQYGLDIEGEIIRMLSEEITRTIDEDIIRSLNNETREGLRS
jgi:hypothetical protein